MPHKTCACGGSARYVFTLTNLDGEVLDTDVVCRECVTEGWRPQVPAVRDEGKELRRLCSCGAFEVQPGRIFDSGSTDRESDRETHTTTLCTRGRSGRVIATGARS